MENEIKSILNGLRHISTQLNEVKASSCAKATADRLGTSGEISQKEWESQSTEVNEISAALVEFQGKLPGYGVDSQGYNFKYASYPAIRAHIQSHLEECGLAVKHTEDWIDGMMMIITTLHHSSGQWMRGRAPLFLPSRKDMQNNKEFYQEYGKAVSYVKRYALENILGIKADKDEYDNAR